MSKKLINKLRGLKEPRPLPEIQKEYSQVSGQCAAASYQAWIYKGQAEQLHKRMQELNEEATSRNRINSEANAAIKSKEAAGNG